MSINQHYRYQPLQRAKYAVDEPLELMLKAATQLQGQHNENYAFMQEAPSALSVKVHKADYENRSRIEKEYKDTIAELAKKYDGNYAQANKDIIGLKAKLKTDLGPSGRLGNMVNNYGAYASYTKDILADKTLTNAQQQRAIQFSDERFGKQGGTGTPNEYGQVNNYNGHALTGFDIPEFFRKMPDIKPNSTDTWDIARRSDGTGYFIDKRTKEEIVEPERVEDIMMNALAGSQKFNEYNRGMTEMGMGLDRASIKAAIDTEKGLRAYSKKENDFKRTWNPMLDYNQRAAHHRDKMNLGNQMLQQQTQMMESSMTTPFSEEKGWEDIGAETTIKSNAPGVNSPYAGMYGTINPNIVIRNKPEDTAFTYSNIDKYSVTSEQKAKMKEGADIYMNQYMAQQGKNWLSMSTADKDKAMKEIQMDGGKLSESKMKGFKLAAMQSYNSIQKEMQNHKKPIAMFNPEASKMASYEVMNQGSQLVVRPQVGSNADDRTIESMVKSAPGLVGRLSDYDKGIAMVDSYKAITKPGEVFVAVHGQDTHETGSRIGTIYYGDADGKPRPLKYGNQDKFQFPTLWLNDQDLIKGANSKYNNKNTKTTVAYQGDRALAIKQNEDPRGHTNIFLNTMRILDRSIPIQLNDGTMISPMIQNGRPVAYDQYSVYIDSKGKPYKVAGMNEEMNEVKKGLQIEQLTGDNKKYLPMNQNWIND